MIQSRFLQNAAIGAIALISGSAHLIPGAAKHGPVTAAAISIVTGRPPVADSVAPAPTSFLVASVNKALGAFQNGVRPLSHPLALEDAFRSYFAFKAAHPEKVRKPYLYFVDYGLPSTAPRGYVFDMSALRIVDGPFTVAHGRGSSTSRYGEPTRFSNAQGSAATSLGLYVAQETYDFHGKSGGRGYSSVGLRLAGVSGDYNDNARARGVVAHGAPYVTSSKAGRSEGCPAMEQSRAKRLLPTLANGGMVFLFAPKTEWMDKDPWIAASEE